jgi:hypothetical protein
VEGSGLDRGRVVVTFGAGAQPRVPNLLRGDGRDRIGPVMTDVAERLRDELLSHDQDRDDGRGKQDRKPDDLTWNPPDSQTRCLPSTATSA